MKRSIRIPIPWNLLRWVRAVRKDRYHPEQHYMRGPGPANERKQGTGQIKA
jgi:hypothetical protein